MTGLAEPQAEPEPGGLELQMRRIADAFGEYNESRRAPRLGRRSEPMLAGRMAPLAMLEMAVLAGMELNQVPAAYFQVEADDTVTIACQCRRAHRADPNAWCPCGRVFIYADRRLFAASYRAPEAS